MYKLHSKTLTQHHSIYIKTLCNSSTGQVAKKVDCSLRVNEPRVVPRREGQSSHQVIQSHRPWAIVIEQIWPSQMQSEEKARWPEKSRAMKRIWRWNHEIRPLGPRPQGYLQNSMGKDGAWTWTKLRGVILLLLTTFSQKDFLMAVWFQAAQQHWISAGLSTSSWAP